MNHDSRPSPDGLTADRIEGLLAERSWLERLARSLCSDRHDAEDLVQQTLLTGLRQGPRDPGRLRAWLRAVLRHAAAQTRRSTVRRRRREGLIEPAEPVPSVVDALQRAALRRDVVDALLQLPEPYRGTLTLRFLEDRSPAEIGRLEGISAVAIRSRIHRGLEMLRQELDRRHGGREAWRAPLVAWLVPGAAARPPGEAQPPAGVGAGPGPVALSGVAAALLGGVFSLGFWAPVGTPAAPEAADRSRLAIAGVATAQAALFDLRGGRSLRRPVPVQDPVPQAALRVVDEAGDPVVGARVEIWPSEYEVDTLDAATVQAILSGRIQRRPGPLEPLRVGDSGADGRCRIEVPRGSGHLLVTTADGRSSGQVGVGRTGVEQTVVVFRRCLVEGQVVDPQGRPLAGATVILACVGGRVGPGRPTATPRAPAPVWTGADGTFLAWVDAGATFAATATFEDLRVETLRFEAEPGARVGLQLRALGASRILVDLVDAAGEAIVGGGAQAVQAAGPQDSGWRERFVSSPGGDRGAYEVRLPGPGRYLVQATGPDCGLSRPLEVEVTKERPGVPVRVALDELVSLRGRLTSVGGIPLADVALVASLDRSDLPWPVENPAPGGGGMEARTRTEADGTFELAGLHPRFRFGISVVREDGAGNFQVATGLAPGGAERPTIAVPDDRLRGAVVHFQILVDDGSAAPARASIDLWESRDAGWVRVRSGEECPIAGRSLTLEGLDAGRDYQLVVRAEGFATVVQGPWTCRRFADSRDLSLVRPGSIEVRVVDAAGRPVPGARVQADRQGSLPPFGDAYAVQTDAGGLAVMTGLAPGPTVLHGHLGTRTCEPVQVEVRSGQRLRQTLRLR
jgi:RNA polymerase sigma factor (sigma-70 family)